MKNFIKDSLKLAAICGLGFLGAVTIGEASETEGLALRLWMLFGTLSEWLLAGLLYRRWVK